MDKRELNIRLNGLKDAYPNELVLIEGIQNILNKNLEVISEKNRHALRQFPLQFTRRVNLGDGEWTTTLHMWADNLVEDLLDIDPLMLTCSDSTGSTVLHSLVFAATGKFTQQVDYEFIRKMLSKNMSYIEMTRPNDINSKAEGNAWFATDAYGKTAMDYLIEFANGENGMGEDPTLEELLEEFAQSPTEELPVDNTPQMPVSNNDLAAADQQMGITPEGEVDPQAIANTPPPTPEEQNQVDITVAQDAQAAKDAGAAPEKEIASAINVAKATCQEKAKEDGEIPILETLLGMASPD